MMMELAKIHVNGVRAYAVYRKSITAGIIGATVSFEFDSAWDGLTKTVVFKGVVTKDVLNAGAVATIPAEVVAEPDVRLEVGVYGVDADANIAIPTLWADLGFICRAADPSGDTSTDPSMPVWAQLEKRVSDLEENGVAVDKDSIERGIQEYMRENPPVQFETDETLILESGILRVNTADVVEKDNTLPVTSAAVQTVVGNIGAILDTI